jgi:non-ribosomal peptide synthetase component F
MSLLSALAALLTRYSGQEDIVIGSPANRQDAQLDRPIDFHANSLVMRMRVTSERSFRELIAHVRGTTLEAQLHQNMPREQLFEKLSPDRRLSSTPLFQVMFVLQNAPAGHGRRQDVEVTSVAGGKPQVRFDLEHSRVDFFGRERAKSC